MKETSLPLDPLQACSQAADDRRLERRLRWLGRLVAILLCGLHAWVARHTMNPDGISYLDVGDAYGRGDWGNALNTYWSPLYCWILEAVLALVRPTPYWECAVVHAVNFAVFLLALVCFELLLGELLARQWREPTSSTSALLPGWLVLGLLYVFFIWTSRRLITVSHVTPDMLVAACVYLSAALILRSSRRQPTVWLSLGLGLVLGLGYLAKAVLFPLGFVFLGASVLAAGSWRQAVRHLLLCGTVFLMVSGSFIAALSLAKGRPTFGDSGRLNYTWYVAGVKQTHWQGSKEPSLQPAHPPQQLHQRPAAYALAGPVGGTYPLWFDPSYWYDGVHAPLNLRSQAQALARAAVEYFVLLAEKMGALSGAMVVLVLFCLFTQQGRLAQTVQWSMRLCRLYPLLAPGLAVVVVYGLVGHVEGRLIGPFLVLLAAAVLLSLRLADAQADGARSLGKALLAALSILVAINVAFDAGNAIKSWRKGEGAVVHPGWQLAEHLHRQGFPAGESMACIGYSFDAYWARLGGYRILAEVPEDEATRFWRMSDSVRQEVLQRLRQAGAAAVVAQTSAEDVPGWSKVPGTSFSVFILRSPEAGASSSRMGPRREARPVASTSLSPHTR